MTSRDLPVFGMLVCVQVAEQRTRLFRKLQRGLRAGGAVIGLMTGLRICEIVLSVGAEANVEIAHRRWRQALGSTTLGSPSPLEKVRNSPLLPVSQSTSQSLPRSPVGHKIEVCSFMQLFGRRDAVLRALASLSLCRSGNLALSEAVRKGRVGLPTDAAAIG